MADNVLNIDGQQYKETDLSDKQIKEEVLELVFQKNKFDYNQKLLNEQEKTDLIEMIGTFASLWGDNA